MSSPAGPATTKVVKGEQQYCKLCKIHFPTWVLYHKHKVQSINHITCETCSVDFFNPESLAIHRKQLHPKEQDLQCPRCKENFIRLGSLINHIENTGCKLMKKISGFDLYAAYDNDNTNAEDAYKSMCNYLKYGTTSGDFRDNEPPPNSSISDTPGPAWGMSTTVPLPLIDLGERQNSSIKSRPIAEEEDLLLSYDEPSAILNSGWDLKPKVPRVNDNRDFPTLGVAKSPVSTQEGVLKTGLTHNSKEKVSSVWSQKTVPSAFPVKMGAEAPLNTARILVNDSEFDRSRPARENTWNQGIQPINQVSGHKKATRAPLSTLPGENTSSFSSNAPRYVEVKVTLAKPEESSAPYDPDNANFNPRTWYNAKLGFYICPHAHCMVTCPSLNSFKSHLRSSKHRNLRLMCNSCNRYFADATALTQHSEAQGVRCLVRDTDQFDAEVQKITGGVAAVAGTLEDETIRYAVSSDLLDHGATAITEANRAESAAIAARRNDYWNRHVPEW